MFYLRITHTVTIWHLMFVNERRQKTEDCCRGLFYDLLTMSHFYVVVWMSCWWLFWLHRHFPAVSQQLYHPIRPVNEDIWLKGLWGTCKKLEGCVCVWEAGGLIVSRFYQDPVVKREPSGKDLSRCLSVSVPTLTFGRGRKTLMQTVEMSFLHQAADSDFVMNNPFIMLIFLIVLTTSH